MRTGTARWTLLAIALVLAMFVTACGGEVGTPSAPTQAGTSTQTPTPTPVPTPTQTFDLSPYVGVWDLTWRQTEVEDTGHGGCVAATMQPMTGVPVKIILTVTKSDMTITSPWGDRTCTYRDFKAHEGGFDLGGGFIKITCNPPALAFRCSDGTWQYNLVEWGLDLQGRLSGNELVGAFGSEFGEIGNDAFFVGSFGQFTGTRR